MYLYVSSLLQTLNRTFLHKIKKYNEITVISKENLMWAKDKR